MIKLNGIMELAHMARVTGACPHFFTVVATSVCVCFLKEQGHPNVQPLFFVCMLQLLVPDETGMTCKNRHGTRMLLSLLSAILQYHVCFFFCPPFACLLKVLIRKNKKKTKIKIYSTLIEPDKQS